nr:alpha/beta hydrolase [Neobacillus sp. Marseille-Q6967]
MIKRISEKTKNGVAYTLLKQESTKLTIILPGMGYTVQAPLLFYSTSLMFSKGYDVLHINYQYDKDFSDLSIEKQIRHIFDDVDSVLHEVLTSYPYTDFTFIAKSIGTVGLASLVNYERFFNAKIVWLTPLITKDFVFQEMGFAAQESLVIIGDNDPVYDAERLEALKSNKNMIIRVITGVNHGLEYENDIYNSIEIIKLVTKEIDHFTSQ